MHGPSPNVLPLFQRPREKDYRAAVAKIIRDVKARHNLSNIALAEEIGCCAETIGNAENEANSLNAVILGAIRWRFGADAVRPWDDLCDGQIADPEPTPAERIDRIERELGEMRKALA